MLGTVLIFDGPSFNGHAISPIFGVLVCTVLTLMAIPVHYDATQYPKHVSTA